MAYPAIVRESVSVGAVYDAREGPFSYASGAQTTESGPDRITPFSQRLHRTVAPETFTDVFAPGAPITSSGIESDEGESTQHGTSQATPVTVGEALSRQAQAGRERAARERVERVKQALEEIEKINESKTKNHKKKSEQKEARSSTSDPQARVMKMADGGFRPAYNGEFAVDVNSGTVVGVEATNQVDQGQMEPMLAQIEERYGHNPAEHLVDGGFVTVHDLEAAYQRQVKVYAPVPKKQAPGFNPAAEAAGPGVQSWRERMQTEAAKTIYPQRSASSEWVNAQARNRGLQQLRVRGMQKVRSILLWFALVHNLWVSLRLHASHQVGMG